MILKLLLIFFYVLLAVSEMALSKWEAVARSYDPLKAGSIDGTDTTPHDHAVVRAMEVI